MNDWVEQRDWRHSYSVSYLIVSINQGEERSVNKTIGRLTRLPNNNTDYNA